jgi:hypothetical protein
MAKRKKYDEKLLEILFRHHDHPMFAPATREALIGARRNAVRT